MTYSNNLIKPNVGEATITGLPEVRWTAASGGNRRADRGQPIFDPATNAKVSLFGEPSYENLVLTTPATTNAIIRLDRWLQRNKDRTDITVVSTISNLRFTFTKCSIAEDDTYIGYDKDGNQTTAGKLRIALAVGGRQPLG